MRSGWLVASAATAASAATVSAATTAAVTATASAATAATGAFFAGLGFVDGKGTSAVLLTVKGSDRSLRFGIGGHLDETEALGASGVAVLDDLGAFDGSMLREQLFERGIVHVVAEVTHVQLFAHDKFSKRQGNDPHFTFKVEVKGAYVSAQKDRWRWEQQAG